MNAVRFSLAFGVLTLLSGCVTSQHPLSDPMSAVPDEQLRGIWEQEDNDGSRAFLFIGKEANLPLDPDRKDIEPGLMHVLFVEEDSGKEGNERQPQVDVDSRMFVSHIGDEHYMNIYFDYRDRWSYYGLYEYMKEAGLDRDDKQFEQRLRRDIKGHDRFYMFVKYRVDGDRLELTWLNAEAAAKLVEAGKLAGTVERGGKPFRIVTGVRLSATSEELVAALKNGGDASLFPAESTVTFRRVPRLRRD